MTTIHIKRFKQEKTSTIGRLSMKVSGKDFSCFTLEEDKEGSSSGQDLRIPAGAYHLEWYKSPKFSPRLGKALGVASQDAVRVYNDVVARDRCILIHAGNTHLDTLGCILLGSFYKDGSDSIQQSTQAIKSFYELLKDKDLSQFELVISNEF